MKYLIETHGCQMNVHDSERMAGLLEQAGYEPAADDTDADVIVINTCSVRERAEEKLFTRLGEIRQQGLERGTRPVVAVAGLRRAAGRQADPRALVRRRRHHRDAEHQAAADARRAGARPTPAPARRPLVDIDPLDDVSFPAGRRAARRSGEGLRHHHRRVQRVLRLLRRAVHARPRAHAPGVGHRRRSAAGGRGGRDRDSAPRPDRQSLPGARRSRRATSPRCSSASTRSTDSSESASPARIPGTSRRA